MNRIVVRVLCLLFLVALVGCGGDGSVSGTVTLDGQPVADGTITFVKTEGGTVREGAVIKDGRFQVKLPPGKYKVELSGSKVTGSRKQKGFDGKEETVPLTEPLFPERYNKNSELSEEIKPGTNTLKFDLKSGK